MRELRKEQFGGSNYAEYVDGELVARHQLNKAELRRLESEIKKADETEAPKPEPRQHLQPGRYLALAARATDGNTGRAWVCDLSTVERTSCPPEWEGELVCYVYVK